MLSSLRNTVINFLKSDTDYVILTAIAAGLYPLLYCFNKNFTLVNSWSQLCFYLLLYLAFPVLVGLFSYCFLPKKNSLFAKYKGYILPILNFTFFVLLILVSTYGIREKKITLLVCTIAFILAIVFNKQYKKIVVLQLLLAVLVIPSLVNKVYKAVNYSSDWMLAKDNISQVIFKKKPNVYYIQPDGYANFSELKKGNYNYNNSNFESYLKDKNFKSYANYRSNYFSTLSSNSSLFAMQHHYYNSPNKKSAELYNSRQIIAGNNPVVKIFKKNNYKTNLMLEHSYLLVNRPKLEYDYSNVDYTDISFLARGFEVEKDLAEDLSIAIDTNSNTNNFYFIEKLSPGHITTVLSGVNEIESERENYLTRLAETNEWLKKVIDIIEAKDKNALIIIAADHGGYVGLNATAEARIKQENTKNVKSVFTSVLSIKWPNEAPEIDVNFKTPVNFFRILFSYLSDDEQYLNYLEADKSYLIIKQGAPFGVYQVINDEGDVVFNKYIK